MMLSVFKPMPVTEVPSALLSRMPIASLLALSCLSPVFANGEQERAVHFWWKPAQDGTAFYNEMQVDKSIGGSYFCVCGFSRGYFGIQELTDGKKVVIFSVWDPGNQFDFAARPENVAQDKQVRVLYVDPAVSTKRFGGEGTGQQSFYEFPWELGRTYKFLVKSKPVGDRTSFTAYVFEPKENSWKKLATFATITGGKQLSGYYSFVEDWVNSADTVATEKSCKFSNCWIKATDGTWKSLSTARFTATKGMAANLDAWLDGGKFGLATGGGTQNRHCRVDGELTLSSPPTNPPAGLDSL